MYHEWPLGKIPDHLQRPELAQLKAAGYNFNDPFEVVEIFERKVADYAGSRYAVAVDCCSHGIFLCLKYLNATGTVTIPAHTYVSVAMQIIHAGCKLNLVNQDWTGCYQLKPYPIWDAAPQWRQSMYQGGLHVVSFQAKKAIPIGRGGIILTDDNDAVAWLQKARYDGRNQSTPYINDSIDCQGWHMYMIPEDAARGILLMDARPQDWPDRRGKDFYPDLSTHSFYKNAS